jgi:hypothetical protein
VKLIAFYVSALLIEVWDLMVIGFSFDGRGSGLGGKWLASESGQMSAIRY